MFKNNLSEKLQTAIDQFILWLGNFGETSYDHQTFFASPFGNTIKSLYYKNAVLGTLAVSPLIFLEAFIPSARKFFWKKQRFPIADAHYAMGFALLAKLYDKEEYYQKALHFLNVLIDTRCPEYKNYCWGYPFNWQTRNGIIYADTPLITTVPYVYEAFSYVYEIDKDKKWLEIMRSIAEHALLDIRDFKMSAKSNSCSYSPMSDDKGGVINASAYRAFLLTHASIQFSEKKYWETAEKNINFVIESQQSNGSWFYAVDNIRDFVDHFHTCFVLKALAKIENLKDHEDCRRAIEKGVKYYSENLIDENGLPKPFSKAPRLTVYRKELYDYAECINIAVLLGDKFEILGEILLKVLEDILQRWKKKDGSFRSRKLILGWDNVPMHRWAQAQIFRSICFYLNRNVKK